MPNSEAPRDYINKSGQSTDYAEQVANETKTNLNELKEELRAAIPVQDRLDMPEHTIQAGETITGVLKANCPGAKYENSDLLRLSYAFMFKQAKVKGAEINFVEPGDKLEIKNGTLRVLRKPESRFETFFVELYPWSRSPDIQIDDGAEIVPSGDVVPEPGPAPKPAPEPKAPPVPEEAPPPSEIEEPPPSDIEAPPPSTPEEPRPKERPMPEGAPPPSEFEE